MKLVKQGSALQNQIRTISNVLLVAVKRMFLASEREIA
jgi:hypothetical protein